MNFYGVTMVSIHFYGAEDGELMYGIVLAYWIPMTVKARHKYYSTEVASGFLIYLQF